ncbi:MAG: ATP-binding cassette domain-containing protein [Patescibacteria group bacterium]|jgi:ABC-2 type transport system ATP-binding protein
MISVKKLTKTFQSPVKTGNVLRDFFARKYEMHTAVNNISFDIAEGELIGFVGPNGAGKTTTLKMLSGILHPTSGEVDIFGFHPFEKNKDFLRQIAFVMGQKNQMLWDLPPIDTYILNREIYEIDNKVFKKRLGELVELLDCKKLIDQPVKTLSLGQRMRVELIASLLHQPKVLFLDEPTIGLDIFAQTIITRFIKEYQEQYHSTILLTSHYMKDIQRLASRVILIDAGKLIYDGQLSRLVTEYSSHKYVRVILKKPIDELWLKKTGLRHSYEFPQLTITLHKDGLEKELQLLLRHVDFHDLSLEDEPVEEIIKKVFQKKH